MMATTAEGLRADCAFGGVSGQVQGHRLMPGGERSHVRRCVRSTVRTCVRFPRTNGMQPPFAVGTLQETGSFVMAARGRTGDRGILPHPFTPHRAPLPLRCVLMFCWHRTSGSRTPVPRNATRYVFTYLVVFSRDSLFYLIPTYTVRRPW